MARPIHKEDVVNIRSIRIFAAARLAARELRGAGLLLLMSSKLRWLEKAWSGSTGPRGRISDILRVLTPRPPC